MRPIAIAILVALAGCATLKNCAKPVPSQAATDGAAVLACVVNTGQSLAACEDAQLAVEAGQLTADALMCGEDAIATAYKGTHTTKGPTQ